MHINEMTVFAYIFHWMFIGSVFVPIDQARPRAGDPKFDFQSVINPMTALIGVASCRWAGIVGRENVFFSWSELCDGLVSLIWWQNGRNVENIPIHDVQVPVDGADSDGW